MGISAGIERKEAVGMDRLIEEFIREMKLSAGMNRQRVFAAWDKVSGVAAYTIDKRMDRGVLYCRLSSSVVRSQLYMQRDILLRELNAELEKDNLYDNSKGFVKSIVLK